MSTLAILYKTEGPALFERLHKEVGANPKYLYQIAAGFRKPSAKLARRLIAAEPSLTLEGLLFPNSELKEADHA